MRRPTRSLVKVSAGGRRYYTLSHRKIFLQQTMSNRQEIPIQLKKQIANVPRGRSVYIIKICDIYKIGCTRRLADDRILSAYREAGRPNDFSLFHWIPAIDVQNTLFDPERRLERHFHLKFEHKRISSREHFWLDNDDLRYIKSIKEYRNDEVIFRDRNLACFRGGVYQMVREILDRYNPLHLECDGFTRVAHTVLCRLGIGHEVMVGRLTNTESGESIAPHFWISWGNHIIDYRARMWIAHPKTPHGIFNPSDYPVLHEGEAVEMEPLNDVLFRAMVSDWGAIDGSG